MAQEDITIVQSPRSGSSGTPSAKLRWTRPPADTPATDRDLLFSIRRGILLRNGRAGMLFHMLFAGTVAVVLYNSPAPKILVSAWIVALIAILLIRSVFLGRIADQDAQESGPLIGLAITSGMLIGVAWGLCGLFLFYDLDKAQTIVVVLAMIGAMLGAATNGARMSVFLAWITPAVAPLLVYAVKTSGPGYAAASVAIVLLCLALVRAAHNAKHLFNRAASLVRSVERADERLRESARRFKIIADYSHDWETWFDHNGALVWTSPSVERFTGYTPEDVMLNPQLVTADMVHPDDRERVAKAIVNGAQMPDRGEIEFRVIHRDGSMRWCEAVSNPITDESGAVDGFRSSVRDISVQKRLEADLEQLASVDSLTGLLNRRAFIEKATEEIYRAARYDKPLVVALLDVDHFKGVNDTHGHAAGDRCLVALSDIVRKSIRQSDLFARFGGEEFVLLLPETELPHGLQLCERLRRRIEAARVDADDEAISLSTSIGVADFRHDIKSLDDLLARADMALYQAKRNGRNQVAYAPPTDGLEQPVQTPVNVERLSRSA